MRASKFSWKNPWLSTDVKKKKKKKKKVYAQTEKYPEAYAYIDEYDQSSGYSYPWYDIKTRYLQI